MNTVKFMGNGLNLNKTMINVGDKVIDTNSLRANDLSIANLPTTGAYILSIAPSLDTGVCNIQTKTLDEKVEGKLFTVTVDLPFAQSRWCQSTHAENGKVLSDYFDRSFLIANGLFINELALGARVVFVVVDQVVKARFVKEEMTDQVDFDAILAEFAKY